MMGASMASANHVQCSRDIDNDGFANRKDMKIIEAAMGSKVGAPPYDERADLDQDGLVNGLDREAYSHCTSPPPPPRSTRGARHTSGKAR
jgi:Dockerin type I domain